MSNRQTAVDDALSGDERAVKQALGQHLDTEVQALDFTVTSKLAAARHRAMDQYRTKPAWHSLFGWQSVAAGTATLAVAYVIGGQMLNTTTLQSVPDAAVTLEAGTGVLMEDLTILAEGDDIEFYQNIEFLEWLENNS